MTMRSLLQITSMAGAALLLAACNSTSVRVGGAPEASVQNGVAAAARELRVPAGSIAVDSGSTPRDGGPCAVRAGVTAHRRIGGFNIGIYRKHYQFDSYQRLPNAR